MVVSWDAMDDAMAVGGDTSGSGGVPGWTL
jgi:hypothetical protein